MDKQSGFLVMVIALLLVVIGAFASAFVAMMLSSTNSSIEAISANYSYDLAQAGLEAGTYQLTTAGTCNSAWSSIATVSGQGEYQYNCAVYNASTVTTSALTASSTSVPVVSVTGLASFGAITIDSEVMFYDGISGLTLQNVRRGQSNTTATTHLLAAGVSQSQYIIMGKGGAPTLTTPNGSSTLSQALSLTSYFVAGRSSTNGVILNFNNMSWSTVLTAPATFTFQGMDTNSSYGEAVGFAPGRISSIYTFNGSSWTLGTSSITSTELYDVSCDSANPTNCWAVGVGQSPPRGLSYHAGTQYLATANFILNGISCTSGVCKTVGENRVYSFLMSTATPFASLTSLNNPPSNTINAVACPQPNSCILIRNNGSVYYFNGSLWSSAYSISSAALNNVHCPSTSTCIVVGNSGRIYNCTLPITSAASCVQQTAPGSLDLADVHCNSTSDCLAVGTGSVAYRYIGGSWSSISLPASYTLNAVSGVGNGNMVAFSVFRNQ
jgi:Tfp pilus assembly protein PilX